MKVKLLILSLLVQSILLSNAYAYDGWSEMAAIDIYRVRAGGIVLVKQAVDNPQFPLNCGDKAWMQVGNDDKPLSQYIYSAIVAAFATKSAVKFELKGCSEGGLSGNPVIVGVYVQ